MAVPYRAVPKHAQEGRAAFLELLDREQQVLAGLLVLDGLGRPVEFVHNHWSRPDIPAWMGEPGPTVVAALTRSLFDACAVEPDLLVVSDSVGTTGFCRSVLAPAIPCCRPRPAERGSGYEWEWLNDAPTADMRATGLASELARSGFVMEPFERLRAGLRHVYGASTDE